MVDNCCVVVNPCTVLQEELSFECPPSSVFRVDNHAPPVRVLHHCCPLMCVARWLCEGG